MGVQQTLPDLGSSDPLISLGLGSEVALLSIAPLCLYLLLNWYTSSVLMFFIRRRRGWGSWSLGSLPALVPSDSCVRLEWALGGMAVQMLAAYGRASLPRGCPGGMGMRPSDGVAFPRYVCIAMEALDQLLMACHCQSINLFVESFLKMVAKLLESEKPNLQILGTNSVRSFPRALQWGLGGTLVGHGGRLGQHCYQPFLFGFRL